MPANAGRPGSVITDDHPCFAEQPSAHTSSANAAIRGARYPGHDLSRRRSPHGSLTDGFGRPDASALPIVATLGREPAAHEEPLPPGAVVRIGSTRFRHPWPVHESSLLTVGRYYVDADPNWVVTLTDRITGRRGWFEGAGVGSTHLWGRVNLVGSPDGQRFASWSDRWGDEPDHVQLWNIGDESGAILSRGPKIIHPKPTLLDWIDTVSFSPTSTEIVIRDRQAISVFDASSGQSIRTHRFKDEFIRDFSPRAGLFLTATSDGLRGRLHSASFRMPVERFRAPTAESTEGNLSVLRAGVTNKPSCPIPRPKLDDWQLSRRSTFLRGRQKIASCALSPDGRYLTTGSEMTSVWQMTRRPRS